MFDVYENCLDRTDGSREFFKESREGYLGKMEDVTESQGGEEVVMGEIRKRWEGLRERMEGDDATGERMCDLTSLAHLNLLNFP